MTTFRDRLDEPAGDLDPAVQDATMVLDLPPAGPAPAPVPTTTVGLRWWVAGVALAEAVVALDLDVPVVRPVLALLVLLGLPTFLLHRKVRFPGEGIVRALYAFGTSLLGLMLLALALNTALPVLGVDRPLQPVVLAATSFAVDLGLLLWRAEPLPVPSPTATARRVAALRIEPAQALGVLAVVLAVAGAVRLDNGAGGQVALAAHVAVAGAVLALMLRGPAGGPAGARGVGRDARTLALVATALLLATSLRGWAITGHDIQAEFYAFTLTDGAQHWSAGLLQNAYNACLSVTILPSVLVQTTGLSAVLVFKVLLQLVFALVPVLTFLLSRRFLPRRLALGAAVLTMAFPTFFTDMPYLVRQEVAFFFLALLLLAATEPDRSPERLRGLVVLFGVGVIVSHYSTTYVMLLGLVAGMLALGAARLVARRWGTGPVAEGRPLVLLSPVVVVVLALLSAVWTGPVTHTGGQAAEVARTTVATLLGRGDGTPGSSDLSYLLFSRDETTPRERLDSFVQETLDARKQARPGDLLVRHPGRPELRPEIVRPSTVPLTWLGRALDGVGIDPSFVGTGARLACAALMQVFLLVGVAALVVRRRRGARRRPLPPVPPEHVCVVLGSMAALALVVLVPNLSVEYGVLRAFQQTLLLTAPVMVGGMWLVLRVFGSRAAALAVAVPVGVLVVLTGVAPALLGGGPARLALENSGLYHDRYLAADSDVTSMEWLADAPDPAPDPDASRPKVIAERNYTIRILTAGARPYDVVDRMYPTMLTTGSYVFVDSHLARTRRSTVFYSGDLITYRYPLQDLDRRLDLVYSAGHTRVYR